ncbi:hypothetical protein NEMIN01_2127 [Nematocida minor]|uniref:uncharacterized protein n=1 Tax=Nematocida minor TaxID=1912983 RepID=UPI00221F406E|nr:uncharacterized protein NEMIN01_2127 [Nematocida minor]KAI5192639.1 hypothetical protein NEMIN01_2127 [Nematocida minor]
MSTPIWLLNGSSKTVILKSILNDINGMSYYDDIFNIIASSTFATRINYLTKASMVVFLFLRSKSIPILIEDVLIYCNSNKMAFLSLLAKNKGLMPNSLVTREYVSNVLSRIYETFRAHIKLSYSSIHKKMMVLYHSNYYHNKSPLTSILILCFYDSIKKINVIVKEHYPTTTMYSIHKETARISKVLKEDPTDILLADEAANSTEENVENAKNSKNKHKTLKINPRAETPTAEMIKRQEKESKVDRAILLYINGIGADENYATDYEGLLIEGMVKRGYSKEMIMSLTKKGLEYYNEY